MPERCKIAKTLLGTELGHIKEYYGLVGSKFGLSGLFKWLFVGNFLPPNPLHTADWGKNNHFNRKIICPEKIYFAPNHTLI